MNARRILTFFLIILLLSIISILYPTLTGHIVKQDYYPRESAILLRAVDGDTIEAKVGEETWKIRLLGINTPEKTMPRSSGAANFLKQFEGKTLTLVRDKDDTDKYNRKLRYVFYKDRFLNKEILAGGLANSYYTTGLIYEKELLAAEKQAKSQGLGIWQKSQEKCAEDNCIQLEKLDPKEEFFTIKNSCSFTCSLTGWFVKDLGRNTFFLASLASNQEKTYSSDKEVWNNDHDRFTLFDEKGLFVFDYEY